MFDIEKKEAPYNWEIVQKINPGEDVRSLFSYNAVSAAQLARTVLKGKYKGLYNKIYNATKTLPGKEPVLDAVFPFGGNTLFIENNDKLGQFLNQFIQK